MSEQQPEETIASVQDMRQDPDIQAAVEEEQALLDQAVQQAQAQHLLNRAVMLNAQLRRTTRE